jgi:hypothetical protein
MLKCNLFVGSITIAGIQQHWHKVKSEIPKKLLLLPIVSNCQGMLKSRNPLTAEIAKVLRKDRKELKYNILTLRTLHQLSVFCG